MSTNQFNGACFVEVPANAAKKAAGKPATPPSRPTAKPDIAAMRARRAARLSGKLPDGSVILTPEDVAEYARDYLQFVSEENELKAKLAALDNKEAGKFVSVEDLNRQVREVQENLSSVCKDRYSLGAFSEVINEATRLGKVFAAAQAVIETVAGLQPGQTKWSAINETAAYAVKSGVAVSGANEVLSPATDDEVVVNAVQALNDFLSAHQDQREANRKAEEYEFAEHLVDERQMLDMRKAKDSARSLTEFLAGEGTRFVLPLEGQDNKGREQFFGFALLERANGKVVYEKASRLNGAKRLFSWFNKEKGERVIKHGPQTLNNNIAEERNNLLRDAIGDVLAKEVKAAEVREAAAELRDLSGIKAITYQDIRSGDIGVWVVDIHDGTPNNGRPTRLTFHVEGLDVKGGGFRVTNVAPGVMEKEPRLKEYRGQVALTELDNPFWRAVLYHNAGMEYRVKASQLGAAVVTKENVNGMLGLEGVDGLYAAYTVWYPRATEGEEKPKPVNVYYILQRAGDQIKVVWAAPGLSAKLIGREREAAESFPVADLPKMVKTILRQVFAGVWGLRGTDAVKSQAPSHLWPESWFAPAPTTTTPSEENSDASPPVAASYPEAPEESTPADTPGVKPIKGKPIGSTQGKRHGKTKSAN